MAAFLAYHAPPPARTPAIYSTRARAVGRTFSPSVSDGLKTRPTFHAGRQHHNASGATANTSPGYLHAAAAPANRPGSRKPHAPRRASHMAYAARNTLAAKAPSFRPLIETCTTHGWA